MPDIQSLGQEAIVLFFASIVFICVMMVGLLWFGWWVARTRGSLSPYTKQPLMLGVDLPVSIGHHIEEYVKSLQQPENKPFEYSKAAICRSTGRIFPNAVKRGEMIQLDWSFLNESCKGNWVSWGSLSEMQHGIIRLCHRSIEGYQTETSSTKQAPKDIEPYYAVTKPGPLYVDLATKMLLGWQIVPGTNFEILVVQKPVYESIDETL